MTTLKTYSSLLFFCAFAIGLFAQTAPAPNGGPMQNPRPRNVHTSGGGHLACPHSYPAVISEFLFAYIDIESSTPTYTLPANIPAFHLSIKYEDTNLYTSEGINVFTLSKFNCKADPSEFYYYAVFEVPIEILEEQMQSILGQNCIEDPDFNSPIKGRLKFVLSTYNELGELIEYPIGDYPELFDCDYASTSNESQITSFYSNQFKYCCDSNVPVLSYPFLPEPGNEEVNGRTSTEQKQYKITPNPFTSHLILDDDILELRMYNNAGLLVLSKKSMNTNSIEVSQLKSGLYIVQYYDGIKWESKKVFKAE